MCSEHLHKPMYPPACTPTSILLMRVWVNVFPDGHKSRFQRSSAKSTAAKKEQKTQRHTKPIQFSLYQKPRIFFSTPSPTHRGRSCSSSSSAFPSASPPHHLNGCMTVCHLAHFLAGLLDPGSLGIVHGSPESVGQPAILIPCFASGFTFTLRGSRL